LDGAFTSSFLTALLYLSRLACLVWVIDEGLGAEGFEIGAVGFEKGALGFSKIDCFEGSESFGF